MKIAVLGTGNIGYCEATLAIGNGFETVLIGRTEASRQKALAGIEANFNVLIQEGKATVANKVAALKLLTLSDDYADLKEVDFIFEAVAEDLTVKHEVYAAVEGYVSPETIIASTTSAITADLLAQNATHKGRVIVAHPFQPAHLLPLVELVGNEATENWVLEKAKGILEAMERQVVVLNKNIPGFIVNRLAQSMFRESIYMLEQGVASAADIDKAIRYAVGMRYASIGLLEYFDDVGFPLEKAIATTVYPSLCVADKPQNFVENHIKDGEAGRLSGKGMYDWSKRDDEDYLRRKSQPYFDSFNWKLPT